ncbi:gamma-carboxygeranoyl-CoA hydratase [Halopseudomonas salegens]|uniref:Methylglutaconyl-CoA hydratase n=1 Tax=Halopseudomonas salegens TaxID=1434072 RepID=A0A1H2HFA7_9GAMM|nr:gamma-carboxygeranoyl-CoA hydratase [Halopseudomonas salegens]SDU30591.1 methylglutaconyl-CoA hydratase [Halopseudomonas salegens]
MSTFSTLQLDVSPTGIATLWLNRPEKNNAFNAAMISELLQALDAIKEHKDLRFMLLRGHGKHFSAGADLAWMRAAAELDYNANLQDAHALAEVMARLYQLPIPTLAVVQGAAYGGALGLISCCDLAIGANDSQFCLSEVRIGLTPAVISTFVVKAMGERQARRYALTAEAFSGEQAVDLGLLHASYAPEQLDSAVSDWCRTLLDNSPAAMRATKSLLQEVKHGELTPALRRYSEAAIARIRVSPEGQEGLNAFLAKRQPSWRVAAPPSDAEQ